MTAEIVSIRNCATATPGPDPECVALLEKMLARAKAGEIVGFAAALVEGNGITFSTEWGGNVSIGQMAGAIGLLHFGFFRAWDNKK